MLLIEKKLKCPLCGAKNPTHAARCSICTRPLANDPLPSQAVYQEALWSTKIASKGARQRTNPYVVVVFLLVVGAIANYFVFDYGPDWAHEPKVLPRGFEWHTIDNLPGYKVDMPGLPQTATAAVAGTTLTTASVWIDSNWNRVLDDETRSVAAIYDAHLQLHARLITASGPAPTDVAASLTAIVAGISPKADLLDGGVTAVDNPAYGEQYDLRTIYNGWPEQSDHGVVRAHIIVFNGKIFVVAAFINGGDDTDLADRLVSAFQPDGAPGSSGA